MIEIGVVKSANIVANKSIVAVSLKVDLDKVPLGAAFIQFGNQVHASKLSGHKWWPERGEIDLLFDGLSSPPEIGTAIFLVE